jgi:uncharacterized protein
VSIRDEPTPNRPALMRMTWLDLLFAHWPVSPDAFRARIPAELEIETWDERAWVGVVPFRMRSVTGARMPAVPVLSTLDELNVRTYVRHRGRSGVWFFSLDATSRMAVWSAILMFGLPYHHASITVRSGNGSIDYRLSRRRAEARFEATYRPTGPSASPDPGSFEAFLTNRPRLFALHRGRIERTEIDHGPWPLQPAEAEIRHNTMAEANGIHLSTGQPHLLFSSRLDVRAWAPVRS